jgi:hypothetical protein
MKPKKKNSEFKNIANERRPSFVSEFWYFLKHNKKWWLLPIIIILLLMSLLLLLGGSGLAPFIYPLF